LVAAVASMLAACSMMPGRDAGSNAQQTMGSSDVRHEWGRGAYQGPAPRRYGLAGMTLPEALAGVVIRGKVAAMGAPPLHAWHLRSFLQTRHVRQPMSNAWMSWPDLIDDGSAGQQIDQQSGCGAT
jgi:hypothetical protein